MPMSIMQLCFDILDDGSKEWATVWKHFDLMQRRCMSTITTKEEFFARPFEERIEFYQWMMKQAPNMN